MARVLVRRGGAVVSYQDDKGYPEFALPGTGRARKTPCGENLREFRAGGMERARGIEPLSKAWEAFVLPLNYARAR